MENRLPLDQEWGWDNTCNQQKESHHHTNAKVKDHTQKDLIDYGFLVLVDVPPSLFLSNHCEIYKSWTGSKGHDKTTQGELTWFLGCIFFMACTSGFAKEEYWSTKPVSMMEGAVSLRFYSPSSSNFIANQFRFHPLTTSSSLSQTQLQPYCLKRTQQRTQRAKMCAKWTWEQPLC